MADWIDIEVSRLPRSRRVQDVLSFLVECLAFWDFLACCLCGATALALFGAMVGQISRRGLFVHDIVLGSLIAALTLRRPMMKDHRHIVTIQQHVIEASGRCFLAFCALLAVVSITHSSQEWARLWLVAWFVLFFATVVATRWALSRYCRRLYARGALREAVAIVGPQGPRDRLAARLSGEMDIVAICGALPVDGGGQPSQEDISHLLELGRDGSVDSVVVAVENEPHWDIAQLVEQLKALPVEVAICADGAWSAVPTPDLRILGGVPVAVVAHRPIHGRDLLIKTFFDKAVAILILAMSLPLILMIAALIAGTSKGPVIFSQARQGWCGRYFMVYKFRTMRVPPNGGLWTTQTTRDDVRCTRVGRLLRRISLDELPQLWNVLRGDMSLVGPRPHAYELHDVDRAGYKIVAEYAQRNRMKPGITGWAQIHGARGPTANLAQLRQRVAYDLHYIENWSLWLDVQILARTPFCLTGENVY